MFIPASYLAQVEIQLTAQKELTKRVNKLRLALYFLRVGTHTVSNQRFSLFLPHPHSSPPPSAGLFLYLLCSSLCADAAIPGVGPS